MLYTIGHSNQSFEQFSSLLNLYSITYVVDVRSVPYSSYCKQFNRESLQQHLAELGITYLHMGLEFGAHQSSALDSSGQVDFSKVQELSTFQSGVPKILNLLNQGVNVALMCSEADPLQCHRLFISHYLQDQEEVPIFHILKDSSIITHHHLESMMVTDYIKRKRIQPISHPNLFGEEVTKEQQIKLAYKLKNTEIGWKLNDDESVRL